MCFSTIKKTPIEVWSGSPLDYTALNIFGCPAYAHVNNGKLEPRAIKCIYLGYKPGVKGYKLWNPETRKIEIGGSVTPKCFVHVVFQRLAWRLMPAMTTFGMVENF
jgi:hypothetical protein